MAGGEITFACRCNDFGGENVPRRPSTGRASSGKVVFYQNVLARLLPAPVHRSTIRSLLLVKIMSVQFTARSTLLPHSGLRFPLTVRI